MNRSQMELIIEDLESMQTQFYRILKENKVGGDELRREILQFDEPYERTVKRIKLIVDPAT